MISEAAVIVENAFRDVLGFNEAALAKLSLDDKFQLYCSSAQLNLILSFVRTDSSGGLPSMIPSRDIQIEALVGIGIGTTIRTLVRRLSDFAFFIE